MASWPWGSLFRRFCRFCSLWGLTVSLSSLFFPILMHSLGDVWHPGPGVPCFGGFAGFAAFGGSQSHFLPSSSLVFPILMHSLGDVWHPGPWGLFRRFWKFVPCFGGFGGFCSLWGLTVSLSSLFFPILMHSLGDVWHPGPGVPCFGGFAGFAAFGAHSLTFFPILPSLNAFLR